MDGEAFGTKPESEEVYYRPHIKQTSEGGLFILE